MTLIRKNDKIITKWYMKEIASGRMLNFHSSHPYFMKKNVAESFARRVTQLSDECFREENYRRIREMLKINSYPRKMINKIIKNLIYTNKNKDINERNNNIHTALNETYDNIQIYRGFPYITEMSDGIRSIVQKMDKNIILGLQPPKKLGNTIFSNTKTKVKKPPWGVVYQINCMGNTQEEDSTCKNVYIGETKFTMKKRMNEHKNDFKKSKEKSERNLELNISPPSHFPTAACDHAIIHEHEFDFENPILLEKQQHFHKRKNLEALHIIFNSDIAVNMKRDTYNVDPQIKNIINIYKHSHERTHYKRRQQKSIHKQ